MLVIDIPETEYFDENTNEFVTVKAQSIHLEHSLISVSKWESKWKKPFLTDEVKTSDELLDYVTCMAIGPFDTRVLSALTPKHIESINDYINDSMTATWFREETKKTVNKKQVITSEVIYYDMIALQIPFECQKWHLNRLLTLIRVCQEKNKPPKKMSKSELMRRNRSLNAARRSAYNTSG